ncbi:TonB-dependent receptor [Sphingomonas sp. AP4-R1]|uniref:TonB-dependent receptor domain-containing protein n=1 Tax=Sphingomonas sp. AP4-R1 TaxID=2735134 RepID=UPI001493BBAC|nr:TonB-dependent receptor [Sphingomonas sp. AP4-R1]QJU60281.1 TonB-dependent receptor [Sphingomonas sp. AP4-R1]
MIGWLGATSLVAMTPARAAEPPAQTATIAFAIEAGPLQHALVAYAAATGIELLYASDVVEGRTAPRLVGSYTPAAALALLLKGSGLGARKIRERVFVLEATKGVAKVPVSAAPRTAEAGTQIAGDQAAPAADPITSDRLAELAAERAAIVITGTHIRGLSPGSPPIIQIDRGDLTRNGYATVSKALQALPGNFSGTATEQSALSGADTTGTNATLATGVNLRGLGAGATLVLVNGQRLGGAGAEGAFGDVSMIPTGAFDRAEVLLDGASAVYGSDAVGGVVNILLRRRFKGAETQVRFGTVTTGGKRDVQAAQTHGHRWATGGVMLSYEYDRQGRLESADRSFARASDLTPLGGTNHDLFYSLPGNVLAVDPRTGQLAAAYAIPAGQDGRSLRPSDFQRGVTNLQNRRLGSDLIPRQIRHSVYASADQEISDGITLMADVRYAHRAFDSRLPGAVAVAQVTRANPYFVSPTGAASDIIAYSLAQEAGPTRSYGFAEALASSVSMDAELGRGWTLRSYGAFAQERERNVTDRMVNVTALNEALGTTPDNPTTPFSTAVDGYFNPYGTGASNSGAILDYVSNGFNDSHIRSRIWTGHVDADGSLVDLPGGAVKVALGGDVRRESFATYGTGRTGGVGVRTLYDVAGARTVTAGFVELRAPLFGPDNARAGFQRLEFTAAARVEHYAVFGTTTNPKLGASWVPVDGLTLRASWGTSFRAPNLRQLGNAQRYAVTTLTGGSGATLPVIQLTGGNPDLGPEKARSWTAGADLAPRAVPGLTLHATWFHTNFRQRIATPAAENFARALLDPALAPFVQLLNPIANPADLARINALLASPAFSGSNPFPVTSIAGIVDTRYVNTGRVIVSGLDLQAGYTFTVGPDRFELGASGSYLDSYRERVTPTSVPVDRLNLVGRPVDLRGRATAGWRRGIVDAQIGVNHVAGYRDLTNRRIDAWTTADLQIGLTASSSARGWLTGMTLSLAVSNILNTAPPFYDSPVGLGYDAANADALGRFVSLQLTRRW